MLVDLTATSNPITVVPQLSGPQGADGVVVLAAVFAPGTVSARAGSRLSVKYAVTNAAPLVFMLKGKSALTRTVSARAGANTLRWKLPESLKAGKYSLRMSFHGTVKATTKMRVSRWHRGRGWVPPGLSEVGFRRVWLVATRAVNA